MWYDDDKYIQEGLDGYLWICDMILNKCVLLNLRFNDFPTLIAMNIWMSRHPVTSKFELVSKINQYIDIKVILEFSLWFTGMESKTVIIILVMQKHLFNRTDLLGLWISFQLLIGSFYHEVWKCS